MILKSTAQPDWLLIDWGTTNFRIFAMSDSSVLDKLELKKGLAEVGKGHFSDTLETILFQWLDGYEKYPIYLAGMVGAAQGWHNVPYATTPLKLQDLSKLAFQFPLEWGASATIIPGVHHKFSDGSNDVMRGEEVQLLGMSELSGEKSFVAVLPGTHSKHAVFEGGELISFSSFMTGELFSVASSHSILGRDLPPQEDSERAFYLGIKESKCEHFTHTLFNTRTHRLFGLIRESEVNSYLSGLLIGAELRSVKSEQVYLVGGDKLCNKYAQACVRLGLEAQFYDGDECFLSGMNVIKGSM